MPRPITATIDLSALRHNLAVARRHAGEASVWAVIKANAYGHGTSEAARAFAEADGFALLDPSEALDLRATGVRKPILLLEGVFDDGDVATAREHDLAVVVHSDAQIDCIERCNAGPAIDVYLKINTGMNRLGFSPEACRAPHARLNALPGVRSVTLMTHFADADGARGIAEQMAEFEAATLDLPGKRSLANSAALLRHPQARGDWVRPGIMLYGCSPFADESAAALGLRPAMTLSSRLIAVQALRAGERVGYGGAFVADRPMRIGVVACGYADGYPRHAPTGTPVLVDGQRTTVVGRVSMDMLTVDLTPVPAASIGSAVTLWGEGLSADEVAIAAGTLSYELLCALAPRVPTVVLE